MRITTSDFRHVAVGDCRALKPATLCFPVRAVFSTKLRPPRFRGKIEFRDVHFAFPTDLRTPVLQGLSFTVEPGAKVALVGPTGCGKSSCLALLQRLDLSAARSCWTTCRSKSMTCTFSVHAL